MQSNFTPRAGQVIVNAKKEAGRYNHHYVGTEHILLGLIGLNEGIAINVLQKLGADPTIIRSEIENAVGFGPDTKVVGEAPFTPKANNVIRYAIEEAQKMGHSYVGTEHILLGLLREQEGVAARVLNGLGVTLDAARRLVSEELNALDMPSSPQHEEQGPGGVPGQQQGQKQQGPKSETPALDAFGHDLTKAAREGKLDPIIGREKEIERVIQILCRRQKNNPVLIGEAGVGKTAIVEGLAQQMARGDVPEMLMNKRVVMLDITLLVAGTVYRGQFEERIKAVMNEIKRSGKVIVFIDEMHTIVGAGAAMGSNDASNIIKPGLSRGEFQCIGATTMDEYRKYIEKDAALERRFQMVLVEPPTVDDTVAILKGLRRKYEEFHHVHYTDVALDVAARLSDRYVSGRHLPDKAIDLMDEAGARVHLRKRTKSPEIEEQELRIKETAEQKKKAVEDQRYEDAARLRNQERELREELDRLKKKEADSNWATIDVNDIALVLSKWVGIPVTRLEEGEAQKLLRMEDELHKRVVGQHEAITALARSLRRSRANLKDPRRPIGSFIFLGPTGVGKTLLAKALAEFMFDDQDALITVDMSEYMEKFSTSRFVGSPPGYVGYEEGGQLTEKIRRRPYSVVLFDEIEKAHPDVLHMLLQVLEEGKLTDGLGRTVDFRNTVVIMTSNIGAEILRKQTALGFGAGDEDSSYQGMKTKLMDVLKKEFKPEFLNRVDDIIVFRNLAKDELMQIIDLELDEVLKRLAARRIAVELTPAAREFLFNKGYDAQYGARPLRRAIEHHVEDGLSEEILRGRINENDAVRIDCRGDQIVFDVTPRAQPATPAEKSA
ncbi:ATP-dependent Clp protease ATP-binding subunit [bacterium]|nr:ATP-dependent Clp protease ATP-binding subunit [bacterium]